MNKPRPIMVKNGDYHGKLFNLGIKAVQACTVKHCWLVTVHDSLGRNQTHYWAGKRR